MPLEQKTLYEVIYWSMLSGKDVGHVGKLVQEDEVGGEGYVSEVLGGVLICGFDLGHDGESRWMMETLAKRYCAL